MTSIKLTVTGAQIWASVTGVLTSGMVGIPITIEYDEAWDGLTKNLMCRCSPWGSDDGEIRTRLNVGEASTVAHEVMQQGMYLYLGVEGFRADGTLVIPTTWARCGKIEYGANTCDDPSMDPELTIWNQLQTEMEETKKYVLTPEQAVNIQAYAQEARQAAEEAKQAAKHGLYYIPTISQPTDRTLRFAFTPSITGAPTPNPVTVVLPDDEDSGQNGDLSAILETVPDNNLIDASALETQFVNSDGTTVTGKYTNYIPVKRGRWYAVGVGSTQYHFFDADKNHLLTEYSSSNPRVVTPSQDGYMLVKLPTDHSTCVIVEGTDIGAHRPAHQRLKSEYARNPWRGKRWLCIGDSITTDTGVYATTGYGKLISRDLGMVLHNIAVSGKASFWGYEQLDNCADDYDIITVMLGTNDHGYGCVIGSLNDAYYAAGEYANSASFYARVQLLIEKLKQKFPRSLILMLTPIKRTATGDSPSNNDAGYQTNASGLTTEAYRDAVIDVCSYYSIPCVDLYNTIDPRTESNRELYFMSASDGTHPNDLGHALMLAPVIRDAIIRHTPYVFPEWDTAEPDNPDAPDVPVDPDEPEEPGGDTTAPVLIHAYGLGVKGETIEDAVGDSDMTANGEGHGVHCNEGTWNLTRGESFSLRSKATRNTKYYRVSHKLHTGARGGIHVVTGGSTYDMTGRFEFGLGAPEGVTATNGNAVVSFYYLTAHNSTAKSEVLYGSKVVAPGGSVELALTFDADTSTVRIYQDGEKIIEEVTSVPLAVDGLVVYGNWASELPTDASLGASPCEYIELYRGVITV